MQYNVLGVTRTVQTIRDRADGHKAGTPAWLGRDILSRPPHHCEPQIPSLYHLSASLAPFSNRLSEKVCGNH